jgi:hypothetical protein
MKHQFHNDFRHICARDRLTIKKHFDEVQEFSVPEATKKSQDFLPALMRKNMLLGDVTMTSIGYLFVSKNSAFLFRTDDLPNKEVVL